MFPAFLSTMNIFIGNYVEVWLLQFMIPMLRWQVYDRKVNDVIWYSKCYQIHFIFWKNFYMHCIYQKVTRHFNFFHLSPLEILNCTELFWKHYSIDEWISINSTKYASMICEKYNIILILWKQILIFPPTSVRIHWWW